jgi:hypothetical protein
MKSTLPQLLPITARICMAMRLKDARENLAADNLLDCVFFEAGEDVANFCTHQVQRLDNQSAPMVSA